jgi:hypothetical protein
MVSMRARMMRVPEILVGRFPEILVGPRRL